MQVEEQKKHTYDPTFWDNPERAQAIMKEISSEEFWLKAFAKAETAVEEYELALEFAELGELSEAELQNKENLALKAIDDLEFTSTLNEPEDTMDCMLKINAGAGGTESCDWAAMLLRMYGMWAEKSGHKVRELSRQDGDVAGIKSAILEIQGSHVYGLLKGENGVHRLVRPSPFNAQGKRQTSFASVFVYPMVDDTIEIDINPADLDWDTFRASGAGGQHVNKTESAVRVRHLPSGVVVECQEERSQHLNREKALKMLRSELYKIELDKRQAEKAKIESGKQKIEWGSQIRSYVLDDRRVKDHRSNHETSNPDRVLDGDLDDFLKATLMADKL